VREPRYVRRDARAREVTRAVSARTGARECVMNAMAAAAQNE